MKQKLLKILLILVALLVALQFALYAYRIWWSKPNVVITQPQQTQTSSTPKTTPSQAAPALTAATQAPLPPQVKIPTLYKDSPLGINANEIHYEDASIPFIDLFRVSSPFAENVLNLPAAAIEYDKDGWPIHLQGGEAGTKFLGKLPPDILPQGQYTVLYDGEGKLRYGHDVKVISQSAGRDIITFNAGDDNQLDASVVISQSNPQNYLRNIRILPPGGICQNQPTRWVMQANECDKAAGHYLSFVGYYPSIVFNPDYLNFMQNFRAIRFMGMSGITRNPVEHWADRPRIEEANWGGTYGARGVPVEVMVELANRLHKDAWFNLPHAADDDYMRQFATYVRDHLAPDLKIYIEYTNEAWNTTFSHSEYTQKQGIKLGLGNNAVEAGYQYYTIRARQMFKLWEDVFGGHERLVRIIGSWDSRPDITKKLLAYDNTYQAVDAVAIAPYFGGNTKGFRESTTVDDIFRLTTEPDSYRSLPEVLNHVKTQADLAKQFGVQLLGYEGGQGLVDWVTREPTQHPNPLFFAANRDPRMGQLYTEFLNGWQQSGAQLMMLFTAPRTCQWYGCWGLKEHIRQPTEQAPKYNAVMNYINSHQIWWQTEIVTAKPAASPIAASKPLNPNEPVIVWRPADDPERLYFLDNPRTFDTLLETDDWAKKDSFGKWQGKWDADYLYLTVRVYDETVVSDSADPRDDDSIELFIDADNSRNTKPDGVNDFHLVFTCNREHPELAANSAPISAAKLNAIDMDMRRRADGYVLEARIPWSTFNMQPKVSNRIGVELEINDDDDGGKRDKKIAWHATQNNAENDPSLWAVVLFSGR